MDGAKFFMKDFGYKISFILATLTGFFVSLSFSQEILIDLETINPATKQMIIVSVKDEKDFHATLGGWEKEEGVWKNIFNDIPAVIGRSGLAKDNEKREGDGKTPSGIYPLSLSFGEAEQIDTGLEYRQATDNDFWIDDVESPEYNSWVVGLPQAKSYERMKRDDELYQYGIVIEYNMNPVVPGNGSAIFLHIWRGPENSTSGCVAVSKENILKILSWLDQTKNPVIVLKGEDDATVD